MVIFQSALTIGLIILLTVQVLLWREAYLFSVKIGSQALEESLLGGPQAFPFYYLHPLTFFHWYHSSQSNLEQMKSPIKMWNVCVS